MFIKRTLSFVAAAAVSMSAMAWQPSGKVECLAPADPGGGWDFTCRSVGNVLQDLALVDGSVQTVNMAGAGGGVAYAHTVSKRADDNKLLVAASTATTTRLAQGQFPGMNADMVTWVGALGADYGIIAVGKDSEYQSLNALMDAVKANPKSVEVRRWQRTWRLGPPQGADCCQGSGCRQAPLDTLPLLQQWRRGYESGCWWTGGRVHRRYFGSHRLS